MASIIEGLDRRFYPAYSRNWDDQLFRQILLERITPQSDVLDLGAGAGIVSQMNFRGFARRVCGVDPDERVLRNPYLDDARVGTGEAIPYPDSCFDIVFADNVFEHLQRPELVLGEVWRVLKPGGSLLFKTPNAFHYVPLIARITPLAFHRAVNKIRGRAAQDTFPTVYKANSIRAIDRLARTTRFQIVDIRLIEGRPEYLRISPITYLAGLTYERLVNATEALANLRVLLIAELKKPGRNKVPA